MPIRTSDKIAFGGGCHWCTEAVFQSLKGVEKVKQGYIASEGENRSFSEAVIVHFDPKTIPLSVLMEVHLRTHNSTANHSMRKKYRSAVYVFSEEQKTHATLVLNTLKKDFDRDLVTKILPFSRFKASREQIRNYYYNNPKKPFCETYINPKLQLLLQRFSQHTNMKKLKNLEND